MFSVLNVINKVVWGIPLMVMILVVGIYLCKKTGFAQITLFPEALCRFFKQFKKEKNNGNRTSPYRALCTALAATVGTGNLAGVAGAICIGGPGTVFWMWVAAFLGMVTKFAEAALAICFQAKNAAGELVGGPMYMIEKGMGKQWKWLAYIYCFFGVVASFGVGNATQINTVVAGINKMVCGFGGEASPFVNLILGLVLGGLVLVILIGGAKRIGSLAERLVPFAAAVYLLIGVVVLIRNSSRIPQAFSDIFHGALDPRAFGGGVIGSVFLTIRTGTARGVFTNEAGMGTAAIAHATADVTHPVEQGLMGIIEVFLDTIVICTVTALVILCSDAVIPYGTDVGAVLTMDAFVSVYGNWCNVLITGLLCCFAIATVIGWGLYGIRCAQYLFGDSVWKQFAVMQAVMAVVGAVLETNTVWLLADIVNGLMAVPNLIALWYLTPTLSDMVKDYKKSLKKCQTLGSGAVSS